MGSSPTRRPKRKGAAAQCAESVPPKGETVSATDQAGETAPGQGDAQATERVEAEPVDGTGEQAGEGARILRLAPAGARARTHAREAVDIEVATIQARWDEVLGWIAEGKFPGEISRLLRVRVLKLLAFIAEDPARATAADLASQAAAEHFLAEAERVLKEAAPQHVSRARELATHYRWLAERQNRTKYGNKLDVTSGGKPLARPINEVDAELASLLGKQA